MQLKWTITVLSLWPPKCIMHCKTFMVGYFLIYLFLSSLLYYLKGHFSQAVTECCFELSSMFMLLTNFWWCLGTICKPCTHPLSSFQACLSLHSCAEGNSECVLVLAIMSKNFINIKIVCFLEVTWLVFPPYI